MKITTIYEAPTVELIEIDFNSILKASEKGGNSKPNT